MLLTFLFWNVNKRPLQDRIARIVGTHNVDIVMLAEWENGEVALLDAINGLESSIFSIPQTSGSKLLIASRLLVGALTEEFDDPINRLTIRRLRAGPEPGLILAVSHMVSPVNWSRDSQAHQATIYANDIINVEAKLGHARTIWVGDFNMNPFHEGMVVAQGIHAVMTKNQAGKEQRLDLSPIN